MYTQVYTTQGMLGYVHPGIYHPIYTLGTPSYTHGHDCTGVLCMQCVRWRSEEALGSNP